MENKLSIGTAQFGLDYGINNSSGKISFKDANEILKSSLSYGIKILIPLLHMVTQKK